MIQSPLQRRHSSYDSIRSEESASRSKSWAYSIWVNVKPILSILSWYKIDVNNKKCLEVEEYNSVSQNVSFNDEPKSMRIKLVNKLNFADLNTNSYYWVLSWIY